MSRFKDMLKADSAAVFRNEDEFAESVVYCPAGGDEVRISAVVDANPGQVSQSGNSDVQVEEIWVFIGRDPAQAGGGVSEPKIGDKLRRADGRTYALQTIDGGDQDNWELLFTRNTKFLTGQRKDRN